MRRVTIYTTDACSFCSRVKAILGAKDIEFAEINLTKDPDGRAELVRRTGMMSFPQVTVDDKLVGGFAELHRAVETGHLDELLAGE